MTGYTVKKMLPDELILGQSKASMFLLLITLIGIIFITLAILTKYKTINPPETFFNIFLGMGIIFTAGSIIFMIQKVPDKISFNKDMSSIVFTEDNQIYSRSFADYSRFQISGKISKSGDSKSLVYQLNLVSRNSSSLLLCESDNKDELQKTAESMLLYLDIDLLSGGNVIHNGAQKYTKTEPVYPPQNKMSIKKSSSGDTSIYEWNYRKSFAMILLLGAVIFGFNYFFFTAAYPAMNKYNAGLYAGTAILGLIDIFFIITLIFNTFGTNLAEVTDSRFSYRQRIFGFSINHKVFTSDEIAMISSGFTSEENKITVFTKRGMDIFNEMKIFAEMNDLNDKSVLMSLIPKVMELRNNIIEIDGTPLYFYEKLYLENEWSEKLKLKNDIHTSY